MLKKKTQINLFHTWNETNKNSIKSQKRNSSVDHSKQENLNKKTFKNLYPIYPDIPISGQTIIINLYYKDKKLNVKVPLYVQTKYLQFLFHQQIYRYQTSISKTNNLNETVKIIGFQSVDYDILLDYRISLGNGILDRKVNFNCLQYNCEGTVEKYKIYKCLAIGGFSKVYLVRSLEDGKFYAMKVMAKRFIFQNQKQSIIYNQKSICQSIKHPFIVKLNHCFQTRNFLCFVFDYCPGGQLFYYLKSVKRMSQQQAKFYFLQILYGLQYLHQQGIVYRDLKPQNLLIDSDGHLKIADFGLSKSNIDSDQLTYSFCGSAQYMPPEMILKTGHSFGVDYYTLGALLYQLVTGLPPFYSRDQNEIKEAILTQQLTFPSHVTLSDQIKSLLKGLLNKNQKLRLGRLKGIKQVLFHPWIGRVNSQLILSKKLQPPYIPDINEFNFDQNQLGDDQQQFTSTLLNQYSCKLTKKQYQFSQFQYQGPMNLRVEHKKLLQNPQKAKKLNNSNSVSSLKSKSLKKQNSSSNIKRQFLKQKNKNLGLKSSSLKNITNLKMSQKFKGKQLISSKSNKYLNSVFTNNFFVKQNTQQKPKFLKNKKQGKS